MIIITMTKAERAVTLEIQGHAGQAEHGKDLVCAGVSMLTYAFVQFISEHKNSYTEPPVIRLNSGDAYISCTSINRDHQKEFFGAIDVIETGYRLLSDNYPQYVRFTANGDCT